MRRGTPSCATMARSWRSAKGLIGMAGTLVSSDGAAGTVVSSGGTAAKFADEFNRAVLQSERLRVSMVILVLLVIMVRWLAVWLFFPGVIQNQLGGALNLGALGVLGLAALVYEIVVFARISFGLRRNLPVPRTLRFLSALIEVSMPTLAVIVGPEVTSPVYALDTPPVWGYFLFLILATLRLDFWLCAFTGLVAGVAYGALALHFLSLPQSGPIDPLLSAPIQHGTRVLLLVGCGVLAGIVSLQIKRQFMRALRSVEEQNRIVGMFGQHVS